MPPWRGDVALLQRRDSVYEGRPYRLDAGDLETLARLGGFRGAGLPGLTEHCQCCKQTEANVPKVSAATRHCFSRDHRVLPLHLFRVILKKDSEHV